MIRRAAALAASLLLVLGLGGCGYHLAGRGSTLPAHIKTIGVPQFTNATTRPELGQRITERLINQLTARGKYRVVTTTQGVDAILSGSVVSWTSRPVQLSPETAESTRASVTLRASVRFEDVVSGVVRFEDDDYLFTKDYDVVGDPEQYFDTELAAVDAVAEDFARAVISATLQGF